MRIVSWNINSVRLRMPLLRRLAEESAADVICLQETKVADDTFPHGEIEDLFPFRQINGSASGRRGDRLDRVGLIHI